MLGLRRGGVGPADRPLWAAGGALGALEAHGPKSARVLVIFSRSGLLCALYMRASRSKNFFLYVGMRVVCVARRPFWSIAPPTPTPKGGSGFSDFNLRYRVGWFTA